MSKLSVLLSLMVSVGCAARPVVADDSHVQRLLPAVGAAEAAAPSLSLPRIDIDEGRAAVADTNAVNIYMRVNGVWRHDATITVPTTVTATPVRGAVPVLTGMYCLVALSETDGPGAVVVFRRDNTGWQQDAILRPPAPSIQFTSWCLDASGELVVVAGLAAGEGVMCVYRNSDDEWVPDGVLTVPAPAGKRVTQPPMVATDGRRCVAIAATEPLANADLPEVRVYKRDRNGWAIESQWTPQRVWNWTRGIFPVAIDGVTMAVGGFTNDERDVVLIYRRGKDDRWIEETRLPGRAGSIFGLGVDLDGDLVVVSAMSGKSPGSTRDDMVFRRGEACWRRLAWPPESAPNENVGYAVVTDDGRCIVATAESDVLVWEVPETLLGEPLDADLVGAWSHDQVKSALERVAKTRRRLHMAKDPATRDLEDMYASDFRILMARKREAIREEQQGR